MKSFALKFIVSFATGLLLLDLRSAELNFDCLERIKNNYDFILFTIKTEQKDALLAKVECNGKIAFHPLVLTCSDGTIKGMVWFQLDEKENVEFLIADNKNHFKFTLLYGADDKIKEIFRKSYDEPDFQELVNIIKLPPDAKYETIEKELLLTEINIDSSLKRAELALHIYKILAVTQSYRRPSVEIFPNEFLDCLNDFSKGDSSYSDICRIMLNQNSIDCKMRETIRTAFELMPSNNKTIEEWKKKMRENPPDIAIERNVILNCLNEYQNSYLYHTLYPLIYIGSYIDAENTKEASRLIAEYLKKYPEYNEIPNALKKEMYPNEKEELKEYKDMTFDKIIENDKLTPDQKRKTFEDLIDKMQKANDLSAEKIAMIVEKIMILGVKHGHVPAFTLFMNLLPQDENDTASALNYENGIILYYQNEDKLKTMLKTLYPNKYFYYNANRSAPIRVYRQTLTLNNGTGRILYDYFRKVCSVKENVFDNLKSSSPEAYNTSPEAYNTIMKTLIDRYSVAKDANTDSGKKED